jgi:cell division septation protein DedD
MVSLRSQRATQHRIGGSKMTRRELPPVTRLFSKRRSIGTRIAGALALTLAFGVVGFGVATSIYLEQPSHSLMLRAPAIAALLPAAPQDLAAAAPPILAEPEPPPAALPELEPQAGTSAPALAAVAPPAPAPSPAAIAPPPPREAAPSPRRDATAYWVEYGAFVGKTYARRLQQQLAHQGLDAVVVATHGRDGRKLLRVRSPALPDLAAARQAAGTARQALHLAALLHRGSPEAVPETRYRVQFAAFARPRPAARLTRELRRRGVAASIDVVRGTSGKLLYYVRSVRVSDRAHALALGARGRPLLQSDFLVEQSPRQRSLPGMHRAPRPPPRPIAASR